MSGSSPSKIRAETRERIIAIAGGLFDRYGPIKTTIADIAREAEMSPANIYNFFSSRDEIIEAVGELNIAGMIRQLQRGLSRRHGAWDGICYVFSETARQARNHLDNEKDILRLQLLEQQRGWRFIKEYHDFLRQQLERLIRAGVASGEFGEVEPPKAASALFECMISAIDPLLIMRLDPARHARQLSAQLDFLRKALR